MAYIPPHKRHSKDSDTQTPVPCSLIPQFKQTLTLGTKPSSQKRRERIPSSQGHKIIYANHSISRWWPTGADPIPTSLRLEPVPCELIERKTGEKPLVLACDEQLPTEGSQWVTIAEKVEPALRASVRGVKDEMGSDGEETKLSFVARVGKIFFHGDASNCLDAIRKAAAAEADYRNRVNKTFYTNVPSAYMQDVECLVVPTIGFDFDSEKEHYHVKIYDKCRPDSTISCKCTVAEDSGELKVNKIELNQVRHLVEDISCLYKDLDLRLMLVTKRLLKVLNDEEEDCINKLIKSATLDPDVRGGLRWPLGKESVGDRFSIVGAWHTKYKAFKGSTMKLKLRYADRFDFRTSTGEAASEVTIKLTGISRLLRDGDVETGSLMEVLQEAVKLIWDKFLSYNQLHF